MRLHPLFPATCLGLCVATVPIWAVEDWPQWRGSNRDGISREQGLLKSWPASGPPLAWKATGAGEGFSSFAVKDGRLYTLGARDGNEYVMAFDAGSGSKVWETRHGARYSNNRGSGPRGTPTVEGGRVYAYGASGDLSALDVATGKIVWSVNVLKQFGGSNISWGLSESPLVLEDRILVNAGGRGGTMVQRALAAVGVSEGASIVALRKSDGSLIWQSQTDTPGYSSAVMMPVGGIRQAVFFTGDRALGIDVADGRLLWSYDRVANRVANIATPIVRNNRVFLSSDYDTGAALLELTPSDGGIAAREIYFTRNMRNHYSTGVLVGDYLYGFSSAILTAMRFDTGEIAWRDRSVGKGSLAFADDRLYLYGENGTVGLAEANPRQYVEHGRFSINAGSLPTWTQPVIANGIFYLRDQDNLYAYDVRAK